MDYQLILRRAIEAYLYSNCTFEKAMKTAVGMIYGQSAIEPKPRTLASCRVAMGLSQWELAEQSGISRNYLSQLERNPKARATVSLEIAGRLAGVLGIELRELFPEAFEENNK